jgi:hypothetical protein
VTDRLDREEADRLQQIAAEFEHRRSAAAHVPGGVIAAIPAPVARTLLELGWRVDDAGAWISRDGSALPWAEALEQEIARSRGPGT